MNDFYVGLITTAAVIAITETFRFLEKRLVAALTLTGIAFSYVGFSWKDSLSLTYVIMAGAIFFALSYFGYKKNFLLVIIGLVLHGVWDMLFPYISDTAPDGYGIFCLTIDILLAIYFYLRVRPVSSRSLP